MLRGRGKADPSLSHGNGHGIHVSQGKRELRLNKSRLCNIWSDTMSIDKNELYSVTIIFIDDCGKTDFITRGKTVSRLVELENVRKWKRWR